MLELIGTLSGILAAISYLPYTRDILGRKAKPERASWLIWSFLAGIAFFSQLSKGATNSLWFAGLDSLGAFIIFCLSIKYGVGGLTRQDIRALAAAGIGLVLWYVSHDAIYALLITIVIDAIGTSLTVMKTYGDPSTETYPMWLIVCAASILATISIGKFDPVLIAYPLYIFGANFAVVIAKFTAEQKKI